MSFDSPPRAAAQDEESYSIDVTALILSGGPQGPRSKDTGTGAK
jgi:hypothetical protein